MIRKKQGWWRDEFENIDSQQQRSAAQIEEVMAWKLKMNPDFWKWILTSGVNITQPLLKVLLRNVNDFFPLSIVCS